MSGTGRAGGLVDERPPTEPTRTQRASAAVSVQLRRIGVQERGHDSRPRVVRTVGVLRIAAVLAVGALLPSMLSSGTLNTMITVAVYATLAYGLDMTFGLVRILPMSVGAAWGVGAYTTALVANTGTDSLLVVFPAAAGAAAVASMLVGLAALRTQGHYYVILTFMVAEVLRISVSNFAGPLGGINGISMNNSLQLGGKTYSSTASIYWLALGLLVFTMVIWWLVWHSEFGHRMKAVGQNETLAVSLGIWPARYKFYGFALSGAFAGLAGVVHVQHIVHVEPDSFGGWAGVTIALVLLLGGSGYPLGGLLGALLVYLLPSLLGLSAVVSQILFGCTIVIVIVLVPSGAAGLPSRLLDLADAVRTGLGRRGHVSVDGTVGA